MELPLDETTHLFVGKTIESMDADCCNNVQFAFTDGSRVAMHIEVDGNGLPEVLTCTECVTIERRYPDWMYATVPSGSASHSPSPSGSPSSRSWRRSNTSRLGGPNMCFVCERNKGTLLEAIMDFIGPSTVALTKDENEHGSWEKLSIWKDGKILTLTADGDPGGTSSYFHWEVKEA